MGTRTRRHGAHRGVSPRIFATDLGEGSEGSERAQARVENLEASNMRRANKKWKARAHPKLPETLRSACRVFAYVACASVAALTRFHRLKLSLYCCTVRIERYDTLLR